MEKPVNHYGDIIIAIVGIGLLVALVYFLRTPLENGLNSLIGDFTNAGSNQINNIGTITPTQAP